MISFRKQTGTIASFDGTSVYYEFRGDGEAVVLCYGIACLFNHWNFQLQKFSQNYQTLVYDYRAHHKTPPPKDPKNLSIEAIAKDLIEILDHNEIKSANLVAHSFGSQVIFWVYRLRPDLVKKIVLINGLFRNPFELTMSKERILKGIDSFEALYSKSPGLYDKMWSKGAQSPILVLLSSLFGGFNLAKTRMKDIEIYFRGVSGLKLSNFLILFKDMVQSDHEDLLEAIDCPTLIMCGSKDSLTPVEDQKLMNSKIKNSQLVTIPYGSHCVQLDFPEMVNLQIEKFISN